MKSRLNVSISLLVTLGAIGQAAAAAPRYHHQWDPNKIRVEPELSAEVISSLEARGHTVDQSPRHGKR